MDSPELRNASRRCRTADGSGPRLTAALDRLDGGVAQCKRPSFTKGIGLAVAPLSPACPPRPDVSPGLIRTPSVLHRKQRGAYQPIPSSGGFAILAGGSLGVEQR